MTDEIKLGSKTSEFWVTLAPIIATMVNGVSENSEDKKYLMVCACVLGSLYICSRTLVKVTHARILARTSVQDGGSENSQKA